MAITLTFQHKQLYYVYPKKELFMASKYDCMDAGGRALSATNAEEQI
jgi:hypothetical protein